MFIKIVITIILKKKEKKKKEVIDERKMTFKSNKIIITERQTAVLETIRMHLTEKQALAYLKGVGFEMSDTTWYREKNKLEKMKLHRLFHIAAAGFEDQHLETIDEFHLGFKMLWSN